MRIRTIVLGVSAACSTGGPYQELQDQGVDRYLGAFEPTDQSVDEEGVVSHRYAASDGGPMCLRGTDFYTMTRDKGHSDLVIFLQGGGLCYSDFCLAVGGAAPGIPAIDLLDSSESLNPVGDWNQVYVPYCDGSLFGGDVELDDDGDGLVDRYHHGLQNLSAALDQAKQAFPEPKRILLAGSSGGGYGTITGTVLTRIAYPDTPLFVLNDAGVGLGLAGDPAFVWKLINEFQASAIVPGSRPDILDSGHLTPLIGWQLQQDPNLKVAAVSYTEDTVISQIYLAVDPKDFRAWLWDQMEALEDRHAGRFASFLPEGIQHTTLLGDPAGFMDPESEYAQALAPMLGGMDSTAVENVPLGKWIENFVEGRSDWSSLWE